MGALAQADAATALALRVLFLLEAARLELLPPALHEDALQLAALGQDDSNSHRLVADVCAALMDSREQLGLTGLKPLRAGKADAAGALRAAFAQSGGTASVRAAAERLGRLCQAGTRRERKGKGSFYTPGWVADLVARTVLRGVLSGRGLGFGAALSLRILDPAAGAGAFLAAMVDAIAEAAGEGRDENTIRRAVVRDCLRGFELDSLAAEACRLALWLVASRPGRPVAIPAGTVAVRDTLARPAKRRAFDVVVGNPPWGVKLTRDAASALARRARPREGGHPALSGHRDSFLYFLALAADTARDDGAIGLVLPDGLLWEVKYEGMRRHLLARFRPLRVTLLGNALFPGATAPACALCLVGREIAPRRFVVADLRTSPPTSARTSTCPALAPSRPAERGKGGEVCKGRGDSWGARSDAPLSSPHHSFLPPPPWLGRLARRMAKKHRTLGDFGQVFRFHDAGINYATAGLGQALLYTGRRQHRADIPVTRGRDFAALTAPGCSARSAGSGQAWLRHDWRKRVPPGAEVSVREDIYRTAPKLLLRQTGDRPVATVDRSGVYFGRSVIAIAAPSEDDLVWLAAVMNSALFAALYRAVAPEAGRTFAQVKVSKLKLVPVPESCAGPGLAGLARDLLGEVGEERREELIARMDERVAEAYGLTRQEWQRVTAFVGPGPGARARRKGRAGRRSA
jgi:hypothetical protein